MRDALIVGIQCYEKITPGFSYRQIMRNVLARVSLSQITNWKACGLRPSGNEVHCLIDRAIIDYQPFKITKSLGAQAI